MSKSVAVAPVDEPRIVHQGHYRLYQKPDGGLRVQYRRDDKDQDDFFELPGVMVALAQAAAEGRIGPMELMKEMGRFMRGQRGQ